MAFAFLIGSVNISFAVIIGLVLPVNPRLSLPTLSQTAAVGVVKVISRQNFCQDVLLATFSSLLMQRGYLRRCVGCVFAARFSATSSAQRGVHQGLQYLGVTSSFICLKQMSLVSVIFVKKIEAIINIFIIDDAFIHRRKLF